MHKPLIPQLKNNELRSIVFYIFVKNIHPSSGPERRPRKTTKKGHNYCAPFRTRTIYNFYLLMYIDRRADFRPIENVLRRTDAQPDAAVRHALA